jgi:hypothetical protein
MDSNKSSAPGVIHAKRANLVRLHIDEPRVRECQADVHRSVSPRRGAVTRVRGSRASLESCSARVGRDCERLHTSWTHVNIDIPVMY